MPNNYLQTVLQRFREQFGATSKHGGLLGHDTNQYADDEVEQFLKDTLTDFAEEVEKTVIENNERVWTRKLTQDEFYPHQVRNNLRAEQRKKLSHLLGNNEAS